MWETDVYCLTDLGTVSRGRSRHRPRDDKFLYGGRYPFIQTGDVKNSNFYLTKYSQTYNEKGLQQSKLWKKGTLCITIAANIAETAILGIDACFPDSVVGFSKTSLYENGIILGRVGTYCGTIEICKNEFWASDNAIVVKPYEIKDLWFYYYLLKRMNLNLYAGGSAQPLITQGVLKRIKVLSPIAQLRYYFGEKVNVIHEQIQTLQTKNQNLIKQRDLLLPRLMSGKLEV